MQNQNSKKLLGNFLLILAALIWGTSFVFQKEGVTAVAPLAFGASRCLLACISVSIVAFINTKMSKVKRPYAYKRNTIRGGLVCGVFLTIACNLQQLGMVTVSAGKAAFITAFYMLIIPLISFFFFKAKIGVHMWIAVFVGIIGMYLLCVSGESGITKGDILVFFCAIGFSLQMLAVDRYVPMADPLWMSAIQFAVNTVVTGILSLIFEHQSFAGLLNIWPAIVYCGLMSGGAGYTLQMVAQGMTDPTTAGLLLSLESVFGAIAGAILLHERMLPKELAGAIIMFAAVILVQLPIKNKKRF